MATKQNRRIPFADMRPFHFQLREYDELFQHFLYRDMTVGIRLLDEGDAGEVAVGAATVDGEELILDSLAGGLLADGLNACGNISQSEVGDLQFVVILRLGVDLLVKELHTVATGTKGQLLIFKGRGADVNILTTRGDDNITVEIDHCTRGDDRIIH